MITRDEAWEKLHEMMSNKNLIKHCLAVEASMGYYANYFSIPEKDQQMWKVAGLLHDADYEKHPDKHPKVIVDWLTKQDQPEDLINAVASHGFDLGVEAKTKMAKTLRAVDELTGLIIAVALVKSGKLSDVTVSSVQNKWSKKAFAKGVKREDIERGAKEIDVPLDAHIEIVLAALQGISGDLGL